MKNFLKNKKDKLVGLISSNNQDNENIISEDIAIDTYDKKELDRTIADIERTAKRRTPIFSPTTFSDARLIFTTLLHEKEVLVNFAQLNNNDKKRMKDFISGILFARDGQIKKVDNEIFKFNIQH